MLNIQDYQRYSGEKKIALMDNSTVSFLEQAERAGISTKELLEDYDAILSDSDELGAKSAVNTAERRDRQRCTLNTRVPNTTENNGQRHQRANDHILILRDLYIPLHVKIYCPAMVHDGVIDIPTGEWGKLAGIRVILQSGAANGFTADRVKIVIGEKRPIGDGDSCADDPVDQIQIVQHQCVLIISHVERLLYAIR